MSKNLVLSTLLALSSIFVNTNVFASSLVGEWKGTINARYREWDGDRRLRTDERKKYNIDYMFYQNGEYAHLGQPGYEHGIWRKSGNTFRLLPDFNGPPSLINGLYNDIFVTAWKVSGKKRGNKISGTYLMRTTVTVLVPFGLGAINYAEISGKFTARRVNTKQGGRNQKNAALTDITIEDEIKKQLTAAIKHGRVE
jgi:hypothetical protein